jgi:hypothetical protein
MACVRERIRTAEQTWLSAQVKYLEEVTDTDVKQLAERFANEVEGADASRAAIICTEKRIKQYMPKTPVELKEQEGRALVRSQNKEARQKEAAFQLKKAADAEAEIAVYADLVSQFDALAVKTQAICGEGNQFVAVFPEDFDFIRESLSEFQGMERRLREVASRSASVFQAAIACQDLADAVANLAPEKDWAKAHLDSRKCSNPPPAPKINVGKLGNDRRPGSRPGAPRAWNPAEIRHGVRGSQGAERNAEQTVARALERLVRCRAETQKRCSVGERKATANGQDRASLQAEADQLNNQIAITEQKLLQLCQRRRDVEARLRTSEQAQSQADFYIAVVGNGNSSCVFASRVDSAPNVIVELALAKNNCRAPQPRRKRRTTHAAQNILHEPVCFSALGVGSIG